MTRPGGRPITHFGCFLCNGTSYLSNARLGGCDLWNDCVAGQGVHTGYEQENGTVFKEIVHTSSKWTLFQFFSKV